MNSKHAPNLIAILIALLLGTNAMMAAPKAKPEPSGKAPSATKPAPAAEDKMLKLLNARRISKTQVDVAGIVVDTEKHALSFPAEINMTSGVIEVLVCTQKGRSHESLLITDIDPLHLQLALLLLGAKNGSRLLKDTKVPTGTKLTIEIQLDKGKPETAGNWLKSEKDNDPPGKIPWIFVGSNFKKNRCLATLEGNLININSMDLNTIIAPPMEKKYDTTVYVVNEKYVAEKLPKTTSSEKKPIAVTVIIRPERNTTPKKAE